MSIARRCFNRDEYKAILENQFFNRDFEENHTELKAWFEQAKNYFDTEAIALNYFLSKILEQYLKAEKDCLPIINFVYGFHQEMLFKIEEFDENFIDELMRNRFRTEGTSLEEDLLSIPLMYYE